jgi:release factor glutamine methyltransferase
MTAGAAVRKLAEELKNGGVASYRLDAELLVAFALDVPPIRLLVDNKHEVPEEKNNLIKELTNRRLKREPLAYITGTKEFYSLPFFVTKDVLIPRPETEFVVETAFRYAKGDSSVHDLCTGSGAIAISLKNERSDLIISASDISDNAISVAKKKTVLQS